MRVKALGTPPLLKSCCSQTGLAISMILIMVLVPVTTVTFAQNSNYRPVNLNDSLYQFSEKQLIIPAVLAGFGFAQFTIDPVLDLNLAIRTGITGKVTRQCPIDDYSRFVPAAAVYGLNLLGVRGKHNFLDRSIILGTSAVIAGISVSGIKYLSHLQRPDETTYDAFPSGHTATAFACAEFLYQEFKDKSAWYGIAGYAVAAGTGFLRMYNNRHWLTDVVAGAGFGILSTKIAYWVFPRIKTLLFKDIQFHFSLIPSMHPQYGPGKPFE